MCCMWYKCLNEILIADPVVPLVGQVGIFLAPAPAKAPGLALPQTLREQGRSRQTRGAVLSGCRSLFNVSTLPSM